MTDEVNNPSNPDSAGAAPGSGATAALSDAATGKVAKPGRAPASGTARGKLGVFFFALLAFAAMVGLMVLVRGCDTELATNYGSRQLMYEGDTSINGLGVLSELLEEAGHRVSSTTRLMPRVKRSADVIIWCVQDYAKPSQQ